MKPSIILGGKSPMLLMKNAFKKLLTIQILSSLASFIGPLIDAIIIGDFLGSEYIAAFGIISPIVILITAFSNIFNAGSQNLAGRYLGKGDVAKLNGLMSGTVLWGLVFSLVISFIVFAFARPLSVFFGATTENISLCVDYLKMYAIGIMPTILLPSFIGFLQLDNAGKVGVTASTVMTIADVVLDLLAVIVFKNGMIGIGLATSLSYWIAIIIILVHFLGKKTGLRFRGDALARDIKKVVLLGLPAGTFLICNFIRIAITNNIILSVSDLSSVAAFSIQNSLRPLTICLTVGTGVTCLLVSSVIVTERNKEALISELKYILRLGLILSIIFAAGLILLAKYPLALMFTVGEEEAFTDLVTKVIRLFALSVPICMINTVLIYYYQASKNLLRSTIFTVLENILFYILAALVLSKTFGINGIWFSYVIAEVLTLISIFVYVAIKKKKIPTKVSDYLLLSDDKYLPVNDALNIHASSNDEVVGISKEIIDFCKSHNINDRESMIAGLCSEELAAIAIHGNDSKSAYVDVYITYENNTLTIRLQDNGKPFDKSLLAGEVSADDPCANIGIRIARGLASDVTYNVILGMNVFVLSIDLTHLSPS